MRSPLEEIPGVGKRIAAVMKSMGIRQVSDLRKDRAYRPEGEENHESAE